MQSIVIGRSQLYLSRICLPCSYFFRRGKSSSSPKTAVEKGYIVHGFRLLFGKYLYITNTVASAALMSLADFFQQEVENLSAGKQKYSFDWTRNSKPKHFWLNSNNMSR